MIHNFDNTIFNFSQLIQEIYKNKYNFEDELCNLHDILKTFSEKDANELLIIPTLGVNDRKSVFINDYYNFVDSDPRFLDCYKQFIVTYIKPLFPNETQILYQTTPNLRISFPNCTAIGRTQNDPRTDIIGLHSDCDFGHNAEEVNYIIPITNMYDTNSVYYESYEYSNVDYDDYINLKLSPDNFFEGYLNKCRHYNKINETGKTRLSLDLRIIPSSKYTDNNKSSITSNKKLTLGEYFSLI